MSLLNDVQRLVRSGDEAILKYGIESFALEARALLEKASLTEKFSFQEIVEASFKPDFNHKQNFSNFEFSDLPLTLARGEKCFIDLYFWRRRPTTIHNHHFTGAFQSLTGKNLDLEFEFRETRKIGKFHAQGELKEIRRKVLKPGEVVSIGLLDQFIHQNHHQADLTVNLCFRTPDTSHDSLSNYLFSGFRYEKNPKLLHRVESLIRFAQMDELNFQKLDLTIDDGIAFLIQTADFDSNHSRFKNLKLFVENKVKEEAGIDISKLLHDHNVEFEKMEDLYD